MYSVGEEEETFFDTVDNLISEESVNVKQTSDYDVWLMEPESVSERREAFLLRNGFTETIGVERVTESSSRCGIMDDNLLSDRLKSSSEARCSVVYRDQYWLDDDVSIDVEAGGIDETLVSDKPSELNQFQASRLTCRKKGKKVMSWLRSFTQKMQEPKLGIEEARKMTRVRVEQYGKRYMECSAVYVGQELKAHNGRIWTMKFSPDGQYLASSGEDGVVCIWRVTTVDAADKCSYGSPDLSSRKNKSTNAPVVIPDRTFHIEEEPLRKFQGHSGDVLDLAWSTSNHLLTSSMDKTVRLWQADSDNCLGVFHHSNYVTCVQFNPVDESYFISGSIDGKVRVWEITRRRVVEWANVRDIVTAVSYQSNGKGFVVGSLAGICRFYELSGDELLLKAEINIRGRKKSFGNKITGIHFLNNDCQRVMITSGDSKIRILDGLEVVRKYRGLAKSGSQMSASFTSSGKHIVSVGEDSRVYLWDYNDPWIQTSKQAKSMRSCENFFSEGTTVVLPWSDLDIGHNCLSCVSSPTSVLTRDHREASPSSERFSLANWFSMDGSSKASATWPEEKLPLWDFPSAQHCGDHFHQQQHKNVDGCHSRIQSRTWGLVFVTANCHGMIRTFHNYGLPVRI